MFHFLTEKLGLAKDDAGMLLDMGGELMVCQIVNPKKTARIEVPKDLVRKMKQLQPGSADPAWTAKTSEIHIEQQEIRSTAEQGGIFMYHTIAEKFDHLGVDNAPGQESQQKEVALDLRGEKLEGPAVDFSHGDVDAHTPTPGSFEVFAAGVEEGGSQAYTPYKGKPSILEMVAQRISAFAGVPIDPKSELILTSGTQGALFLAMGSNIMPGDKVAFVEPDYFANRKMVEFFNGEMVPIHMAYEEARGCAGIDLEELEKAFQDGAKLFIFSNPNNPVGCIYSPEEIRRIASMAKRYRATLIVDELYSRQVYPGLPYTHLCAEADAPDNIITIMGPSKTESLSGYRLGAAFGTAAIIERMEKLQAIMALRCSGYNQAVFKTWFNEPEGWLTDRVAQHKQIRDDLMKVIEGVPGVSARPTEGGSYLFVTIPELEVSLHDFIRIVRELAGVTVTPGTEFGPQYLHSFRVNFSQDHDKAVDAMKRLFTVMERYRK